MNQTLQEWLNWGMRRRRLNILFIGMNVTLVFGGACWIVTADHEYQSALSAAIFTALALLLAMLHGIANVACLLGRMCATLDSAEDKETARTPETGQVQSRAIENFSVGGGGFNLH